jgi:hypothetical protein
LAVELKRGLGDIQTSIDGSGIFRQGIHSVRTHSCTYEHGGFAPAQSTVRVTDNRHKRLQLPHEHVQTVPGSDERARATALWPAGQRAAPSSLSACSQIMKMKATNMGVSEKGRMSKTE